MKNKLIYTYISVKEVEVFDVGREVVWNMEFTEQGNRFGASVSSMVEKGIIIHRIVIMKGIDYSHSALLKYKIKSL